MGRDESYILDLCDEALGRTGSRQHRFPFLRGDRGHALPVDAYYADLKLVIEYRERQHTEAVPFFNRRMTVTGVDRGEQRRIYDQRRRDILPTEGIDLLEIPFSAFSCSSSGRLTRNRNADLRTLRQLVAEWVLD